MEKALHKVDSGFIMQLQQLYMKELTKIEDPNLLQLLAKISEASYQKVYPLPGCTTIDALIAVIPCTSVLVLLDFVKVFILETNTSTARIGAILIQD
ncbi:hypothetical protein B296_00050759 [Ensete ventricosum]|uniref:Uncharacterized protein n=1 Tax=Ensete ventricosum TaxID=4639 RepID=A0A426XXR9_ENSVE|nr:hypothetical protein B296_00050759 [Ensete ventricosum]